MNPRGKLRNRAHALVERDFSNLCWKRITPTDIDAFVEFSNRLFVFIEAKMIGCALKGGQRLALERLCDACYVKDKRESVAFVVATDGSDNFDYAASYVVEYRHRGEWLKPKSEVVLRDAIDKMRVRFLGNVEEFVGHAAWVCGYESAEEK